MIKWTSKMKEELLKTKKLIDFSKKYNISYSAVRVKYSELGGEKKKVFKKKYKEEQVPNFLKNINKIIKNVDELMNKGYSIYLNENKEKISKCDKEINDYEHLLELSFDNMSDEELINISTNIGITQRKRRIYKTECEFLLSFKKETQDFIIFMNKIIQTSERIDNKMYHTRVLKESDKKQILITSKNNDKLKQLEEENQILKNEKSIILKELCDLKLYNIKDEYQNSLANDWKNLFKKLNKSKQKELISKAEEKYIGINIKEVKDLIVFERLLPEILVKNNMFLSK